jgi:uncharacterized protein (TIGR03437 family)
MVLRSLPALLVCAFSLSAATFGTAVPLVGGASDLVLDEARSRLYLVNSSLAQVEVYSLQQRKFLNPVPTDTTPLSAAISRSGKYLYVTSYDSSSLNVIDLNALTVVNKVSLSAKPEGVAVGHDERVLVSTIGTGTGNLADVLLLYDPSVTTTTSVSNISVTPGPPTPPQLPPPSGRPFLESRGQLLASPDGSLIVGVNIPTGVTTRTVFVYEVSSATVLGSRTVTSASSILSIAPDKSKFMAGLTLFDTSTLQVLAQQNLANAPYPIPPNTNFNTQSSQGGSVFSPDGSVLYAGFDISPVQSPPANANVSQFMIEDPDNLLISMGLQLPENLAGKMVISSDGANIYALSDSGFTAIPISTMNQFPIAAPDSAVATLVYDQCGVTAAQRSAQITVKNAGRGNLTVSAQLLQYSTAGAATLGGGSGTGIPVNAAVVVLPGATSSAAQTAPTLSTQQTSAGTALNFSFNAAAARGLGTISPPHDFAIQSTQAINIPPQVQIYQNFRNSDARGAVIPIQVGISTSEGLQDLAYDSRNQRIYIANSGRNRVEVFDIVQNQFIAPIKVGQLPHSLGLSPNGTTLYVVNTGGENISIVDTVKLQVTGRVAFPPIPLNSTLPLVTPSVVVAHEAGAMFVTSAGQLWDITGGQAVPRGVSAVIGAATSGAPATLTAPVSMAATPAGERVIVLTGNGFAYLYDALANDFVQGRQVFTGAQTGYYGPVAAGPAGAYFVVNGQILNSALTPANPGATSTTSAAAVAALGAGTFVRFSQTPRANANALPPDAGSFDVVDATTGATRSSVPAIEGPLTQPVGTTSATIGGRTMAVDATGSTVYAISESGLSIIPLTPAAASVRPQIANKGAVNLASYQTTVAPNTLISIFGANLGATDTAASAPLPTQLGGVCVTLANSTAIAALPLFATTPGQINAQIPPELPTGSYQLAVRSIANQIASATQTLTVSKYAPAVLVDPQSNQILLYHSGGSPVTKDNPAQRDEPLVMYALGLGPVTGGTATAGAPSPTSPLAQAAGAVEVYFGDPQWTQAAIIVDWAGLTPGFVGLYQLNLRVPGFHISGDSLPVMLKIGTVTSPTTGPLVPVVAVQ